MRELSVIDFTPEMLLLVVGTAFQQSALIYVELPF